MREAGVNAALAPVRGRARFPSDYWLAMLLFAFCGPAAAYLVAVANRGSEQDQAAGAFAVLTLGSAGIAIFSMLMFVRVGKDVLALFLGMAVVADAIVGVADLLGLEMILGRALEIEPAMRPYICNWFFPTLVLAGAWYTLALSAPQKALFRHIPLAAAAAAFVVSIFVLPEWPQAFVIHSRPRQLEVGLFLTYLAAVVSLLYLYRRQGNRFAAWTTFAVMLGIVIGMMGVWQTGMIWAALLRSGQYLLLGVGAWSVTRDSLARADSGRAAMSLSEQLRDTILSSVEHKVMVQQVSRIVGETLGLDAAAVLLQVPDSDDLTIEASYSLKVRRQQPVFGAEVQALVRERLAVGGPPDHPVLLSNGDALAPLIARDDVMGYILAARRPHGGLTDEDLLLLDVAASQLAMGLTNAQLLIESGSRLNRAEALRRLAVQTNSNMPVADLVEMVIRQATALTGMRRGELYLRNADSDDFVKHSRTPGDGDLLMPATGVYRQVLRTGRLQIFGGAETAMAAPLYAGDRIIGALGVHSPTGADTELTEEVQVTLQALADQSAVAIERARLGEKVAKDQQETDALYSISKEVSFVLDVQRGLRRVVELSRAVLRSDVAIIALLETPGKCTISAADGVVEGQPPKVVDPGYLLEAAASGAAVVQTTLTPNDATDSLRRWLVVEGIESLLVVPLHAGSVYLGAMLIGQRSRRVFNDDERYLAERIGRQTSIALENGRLLRSEQETVARLRELDSVKTNLVRSTSHELRTPLIGIKGYTELLIETTADVLNPKQRKQLEVVSRETDNLLQIIQDMTIAADDDTQRLVLDLACFDVVEAATKVAKAAANRVRSRSVALDMEASNGLRPVTADRAKVERVLEHLLDNAVKFTPDGGLIELCLVATDEGLRVTVTDSGVGVSDADRPELFKALNRGSTTMADAVPGTGVGLAFCKAVVTAHGGEIGLADSIPGKGASFWFTLPFDGPAQGRSE